MWSSNCVYTCFPLQSLAFLFFKLLCPFFSFTIILIEMWLCLAFKKLIFEFLFSSYIFLYAYLILFWAFSLLRSLCFYCFGFSFFILSLQSHALLPHIRVFCIPLLLCIYLTLLVLYLSHFNFFFLNLIHLLFLHFQWKNFNIIGAIDLPPVWCSLVMLWRDFQCASVSHTVWCCCHKCLTWFFWIELWTGPTKVNHSIRCTNKIWKDISN